MKDHTELLASTKNRLFKQMRHLGKWAKREGIAYFRVYDRDIPGASLMIDCLPNHWLIWVCEHHMENAALFVDAIGDVLKSIRSQSVVVKERQKNQPLKQSHFQDDVTCIIDEGGLRFHLNLTRYLDTGLFIDHRKTRAHIQSKAKGKRVLNLFSYTGSFSCYALAGGANFVTSVDVNPVYSAWHQRNCQLNHFSQTRYAIVTADVMRFLKTNKSKYDIIVCDPPSFSRSKRAGVERFHVQDHAKELIDQCLRCLKTDGFVLFSTNYRKFKIDKVKNGWSVKNTTSAMCSKDFEGKWMTQCFIIQP